MSATVDGEGDGVLHRFSPGPRFGGRSRYSLSGGTSRVYWSVALASAQQPASRRLRLQNLGLPAAVASLAVAAAIVLGSAISDIGGRSSSPETAVRRYFAALQADDPDAALGALAPATRDRDRAFVENGLGNE